jgi:hypothetical protein
MIQSVVQIPSVFVFRLKRPPRTILPIARLSTPYCKIRVYDPLLRMPPPRWMTLTVRYTSLEHVLREHTTVIVKESPGIALNHSECEGRHGRANVNVRHLRRRTGGCNQHLELADGKADALLSSSNGWHVDDHRNVNVFSPIHVSYLIVNEGWVHRSDRRRTEPLTVTSTRPLLMCIAGCWDHDRRCGVDESSLHLSITG